MSVSVMSMVFENGPRDRGQHSVMLALADNADDKGCAWPGVAVLAWKSRYDERTVLRVIDALEEQGWLTVDRRSHGPRRRGNVYRLNMARLSKAVAPMPVETAPKAAEKAMERRHDGVSPDAQKREANTETCAGRGDTVSCGGRGDIHDTDEVTFSPSRGDMTLAQVLLHEEDAFHNHQEPPIEPSSTPHSPPRGAGGFEKGARLFGRDFGRDHPGITEATAKVLLECGLSNMRSMPTTIRGAMRMDAACTDENPDWSAIAGRMIQARAEYVRALGDGLLKFPVGAKRFFEEMWHSTALWGWDHEKLSQRRRI